MSGWSARELASLGLLAAMAVMLFALESLAPRPLPWLRVGLGNLPVLLVLLEYGLRRALVVSLLKVLLGGLLSGTLGGPATLLGLVAGAASLLAMAAPVRWLPERFSPVGLSILGATVHQVAQLLVAAAYVGRGSVLALVPLSLIAALLGGGGIGLLALWVRPRLTQHRTGVAGGAGR